MLQNVPHQTFELEEEQTAEPIAEQRVLGVAKVACVALAGITLGFSVLDLADMSSSQGLTNFWNMKLRPALASAVAGTDAEIQRDALLQNDSAVIVKANLDLKASTAAAPYVLADGERPVAPVPAPEKKISLSVPKPQMPPARTVNTVRLNVPLEERIPAFMAFASASNEDLASAPPIERISASINAIPEAAGEVAPLAYVPLPRPSPAREAESHEPTPAELLGLDINPKERARAERCLANAVYFESRSEPLRGQFAVAQVVMNRVFSPFYPKDVCSVVYQNANRHLSCQFTFACDGKSKAILDRGAWARATRIAKQTLDGKLWVPEVAKSTHYHATYVRPNWINEMRRMFKTGVHLFYRPYNWGDGSDEQGWVKLKTATAAGAKSEITR